MKVYLFRHGTPPWTFTWSETDPDPPNGMIIDQKEALICKEGAGVAAFKAVYLTGSEEFQLAVADGNEGLPIGFTKEAGILDDYVEVATNGGTILDGFSGLTPKEKYYLDQSTPGAITTTKPTSGEIIFVGIAMSVTKMEIDIYLEETDMTTMVWNEVPTGVIDGANASFTLSANPKSSNKLLFSSNGLLLREGAGQGFTLSGNEVTMAEAPISGDALLATFEK